MIEQMHMEIAKERFLELLAAEPGRDARGAAIHAIEQADEFVNTYRAIGAPEVTAPKLKGCKACFGSGGKKDAPCKVCHGTGKVVA